MGDTVADLSRPVFRLRQSVVSSNLTIAGKRRPRQHRHDGQESCAGKGLLIIDAPDVTVRNLTLQRARVPDGNGAGIRMEGGNLTVDGVHFVNNQNGILTAADPSWTLTVTQ